MQCSDHSTESLSYCIANTIARDNCTCFVKKRLTIALLATVIMSCIYCTDFVNSR